MKQNKLFQYEYERPALATDCAIFGFDGGELKLLLLKREKEPFENTWALPGGFVYMDETAEAAAKRILLEKAGIKEVFIEQLYTFSGIDRDPRERVVSVSHFALVNKSQFELIAGRDTIQAAWHPISELPELGFDHGEIVALAIERLKGKMRYQPIGFELLDAKFTLSQLQLLYEAILQAPIDKRNFRKKILGMGLLKQLEEKEQNVPRKAAYYYSFDKLQYEELMKKGLHFEV
jgi:8-oxo-dGTP diphosphatase